VLSLTQCIYFTFLHPDIRLRLAAIGFATGLQFAIAAAAAFDGHAFAYAARLSRWVPCLRSLPW
jgi:hypothetical protein